MNIKDYKYVVASRVTPIDIQTASPRCCPVRWASTWAPSDHRRARRDQVRQCQLPPRFFPPTSRNEGSVSLFQGRHGCTQPSQPSCVRPTALPAMAASPLTTVDRDPIATGDSVTPSAQLAQDRRQRRWTAPPQKRMAAAALPHTEQSGARGTASLGGLALLLALNAPSP